MKYTDDIGNSYEYTRSTYDECVKASAMSKITALSEGMVVEFDSEEAEYAGLIEEDALSEEDAWESRFDPAD